MSPQVSNIKMDTLVRQQDNSQVRRLETESSNYAEVSATNGIDKTESGAGGFMATRTNSRGNRQQMAGDAAKMKTDQSMVSVEGYASQAIPPLG